MTMKSDMSILAPSRQSFRPRPEAKPIDAWLAQSLGGRFDETLVENVPNELLALVSRFEM
jgi:hypothetical protein